MIKININDNEGSENMGVIEKEISLYRRLSPFERMELKRQGLSWEEVRNKVENTQIIDDNFPVRKIMYSKENEISYIDTILCQSTPQFITIIDLQNREDYFDFMRKVGFVEELPSVDSLSPYPPEIKNIFKQQFDTYVIEKYDKNKYHDYWWTNLKIKPLKREEVEGEFEFPDGHPISRTIYCNHPHDKTKFYPVDTFHKEVFQSKFDEAINTLISLGASSIEVEHKKGWSKDFFVELEANLPAKIKGEYNNSQKGNSSVLFKANYKGHNAPIKPINMKWLEGDSNWNIIINDRLNNNLKDFELQLNYQEDYGINGSLEAKLMKWGFNLGIKYYKYEATVWTIRGEFNTSSSKDEYIENNTELINKDEPIEKIKLLKELLDLGAITETEFNNKKQELLSRI